MGRKAREKAAREKRPAAVRPRSARFDVGLLWSCFLLTGITLVAYANSFDIPFLLDDRRNIEEATAQPLSPSQLWSSGRPLLTLSLAANHALGGFDVTSYHAVNFLAHVACGLLLFGFAGYTLRRPALRQRFAGGTAPVALIAAGIFLLHPIQTGSVAYVVQRAEIFASIALLASVWIAAVGVETGRLWRVLPALAVVGVIGAFSKQTMLAVPLVFAVYDGCFLKGVQGRRWPIYLTLGVVAGIAVFWSAPSIRAALPLATSWASPSLRAASPPGASIQLASLDPSFPLSPGPPPAPEAGPLPTTLTPWQYLSSQFGTVLYYFRLMALPDRLCFDCGCIVPSPVLHSFLRDRVVLPAVVLLGAAAAAYRVRARYPLLAFGLLAPLAALVPSSSVFPLTDVYFEHRLYLPIALLALSAAAGAFGAWKTIVQRGWLTRRTMNALGIAAVTATWVTLGALTVARNRLLGDPLRLWQDTVAQAPEQYRAHNFLGIEYHMRGEHELAMTQFRESVRLRPNIRIYVNLGAECVALGRWDEAIEAFEAAHGRNPNFLIVEYNLAQAYAGAGRLEEALAAAKRATTIEPQDAQSRRLLADLSARLGQRNPTGNVGTPPPGEARAPSFPVARDR